jgi:hypothetical protein
MQAAAVCGHAHQILRASRLCRGAPLLHLPVKVLRQDAATRLEGGLAAALLGGARVLRLLVIPWEGGRGESTGRGGVG